MARCSAPRTVVSPLRRAARLTAVLGAALLARAAPASAQVFVPEGPETRLSAGAAAEIATSAAGTVVAWQGPGDGDPNGVYARRYDPAGAPVGAEFRVNTYTPDIQMAPSVAVDADGDFVVAWQSRGQEADWDVYLQRFSATGERLGGEVRVNPSADGTQAGPAVAMEEGGGFIVAWYGRPSDGVEGEIYARRYGSDGQPVGEAFRVNTSTEDDQESASIATGPGGSFVVVWRDWGAEDAPEIRAQRFDAAGAPLGGEFAVDADAVGDQNYPDVSCAGDGSFVVVWEDYEEGEPGPEPVYDVHARRFDAAGAPVGEAFRVNTYTAGDQYNPRIARDAAGRFVVAWMSSGILGATQDGSSWGVYAQAFSAAGEPDGGEFQLHTHTAGAQLYPVPVVQADGALAVVWGGQGPEGTGAYLRRFRREVVATEPGVEAGLALGLAPSPVAVRGVVTYALPVPGHVRLAAYDLLGREVAVLAEGERPAGRHDAAFDASALAPGAYVLRLETAGRALSRRVTVAR